MSENINQLYSKIDFLVNGGALKSLTDFLTEKGIKALVVEPEDSGVLNVMDAAGIIPQSLTLEDNISKLFASSIAKENYELEYSEGPENWPGVIRVRGSQWKIYILLQNKPANPDELINELKPYAGLIRLWQTFKKISDTEKKLSRLSYMILATKSTLASIFEPMPLQYFASFLTDVLRESLFPKSAAILKDEGNYLTVLNGKVENIPEHTLFRGKFRTFLATGGNSSTKDLSIRCKEYLNENTGFVTLIATPGSLHHFVQVFSFSFCFYL